MVELRLRDHGLVRSAEVFSPFWIDWVKFDIVEGASGDVDLLTALLSHMEYANDYLGPRELRTSPGDAHGPYILGELNSAMFEQILPTTAKNDISKWLVDRSEPEWTFRHLGSAFIDQLPDSGSTYRLPDMRPEHITEIGWIVGSDGGFNEWVFIDENCATLTLVVATDD